MHEKKSIREMNEWELLRHSLRTRVFRYTLLCGLGLWLVTLAAGLGLYSWSLVQQYIGESTVLVRSAAAVAERRVDEEVLARQVMEIYSSLTDAERAKTGTEEYHARFSGITENETYRIMTRTLLMFGDASNINDLYFGVFDRETGALVFICDPDHPGLPGHHTGDWEPVNRDMLEAFLSWDGTGRLFNVGNSRGLGWMCTSGIPLKNDAGEMTGFLLTDVTLENLWAGMKTFALHYTLVMLFTVLLIGFLMTRHITKTLTQPISQITDAAKLYVRDRKNGISDTGHFSRLRIRTGDELENLALVMADMERGLTEYESDLTRITAERERFRTEMDLATHIQADMLPGTFPPFPDRTELDIYASMTPAKEVGGDFYDFFLIDRDHLGLVIADVSGKGVPAALFMMYAMILVQNNAMAGLSPAKVLETVNRQICRNNRQDMFVTVWFGILDLSCGRLVAASAGHEYPVLKQPGRPFTLFRDEHGFVIGGLDGSRYREYQLDLAPDSWLFLYTDGLPEATGAGDEMFGTRRMLDALNSCPETTAKGLLEFVHGTVDRFVGEAPQFDDLTMLGLHYLGSRPEKAGNA